MGDGMTGCADLGGMLLWKNGDVMLFRFVFVYECLVFYYYEFVGEGYCMDYLSLMI